MYARVTVVESAADIDKGAQSFNEQVVPAAKSVDGYKGALLLVDRERGRVMGMTLWESEDARRRGGEAVDAARSAALDAMGVSERPPVDEYDVAASDSIL